MRIKPDLHQTQFLDAVTSSTAPILNRSAAGGGKTQCIAWGMERLIGQKIPPGQIVGACFNRHGKTLLEKRAPKGTRIQTLDSLARGAVYFSLRLMKAQFTWEREAGIQKTRELVTYFAQNYYEGQGEFFTPEQWQDIDALISLCDFCLHTLTNPADWPAVLEMASHYALLLPTDQEFGRQCITQVTAWRFGGIGHRRFGTDYNVQEVFTFPELRYLCATRPDIQFRGACTLFVDEAQDLSLATFTMLHKVAPRRISVGDDAQSLYWWLGADQEVWERTGNLPHSILVDCPITYRLPQTVVAFAQQFVPRLRAAPGAIRGQVIGVPQEDFFKHIRPGHVFITLTNADALSVAVDCLEQNIPAFVKGRDLQGSLLELLDSLTREEGYLFSELPKFLTRWKFRQMSLLSKLSASPEQQIARVIDRSRGLEAVWISAIKQGVNDQETFKDFIQSLFQEQRLRVMVMATTAWKAKGEEYATVWVKDKDLDIPEEEGFRSLQHRNAIYVAITRAKETLYVLGEPGEGKPYLYGIDDVT